ARAGMQEIKEKATGEAVNVVQATKTRGRWKQGSGTSLSSSYICSRCTSNNHSSEKCPCKHLVCNYCKKRGHIAVACFKKRNFEKSKTGTGYPPMHSNSPQGVNRPMSKQNAIFDSDERDVQTMYSLGKPNVSDDWHLCVNIDGVDLNMGIDTGASQSVISRGVYERYFL